VENMTETIIVNEEVLFKDKAVKVYDRKILTYPYKRGALISIGFLRKKELEGKIARLFVKKLSDDSYLLYLKLIPTNSNNKKE
jgi:hypothetical protein